jgi:hypothetical protein
MKAPPHQRNGRNGRNGTPPAPPLKPVPAVVPADPPERPNQGSDGRFQPGNRAGAGNPVHRAIAARRKALLDAVTAEEVAAIGRKLTEQALAGDVAAAKVLLTFVIGRPPEAVNPDAVDLDELRLLMAAPLRLELVAAGMAAVPPDVALEFLRRVLAAVNVAAVTAAREPEDLEQLADLMAAKHKARAKGGAK